MPLSYVVFHSANKAVSCQLNKTSACQPLHSKETETHDSLTAAWQGFAFDVMALLWLMTGVLTA